MLQWSGKEAYLSACGIVNFGLWLCAPVGIFYNSTLIVFINLVIQDNKVTIKLQESLWRFAACSNLSSFSDSWKCHYVSIGGVAV